MKNLIRLWSLSVFAMVVGCGQEAANEAMMPTRPVTVIELSERDYPRERTLTGVVNLYREENIGFEISGRVTTVLNEGLEVRGPAFNEHGELIRQGDPIAVMEGSHPVECVRDGSWLRTRSCQRGDDADATGHSNRIV